MGKEGTGRGRKRRERKEREWGRPSGFAPPEKFPSSATGYRQALLTTSCDLTDYNETHLLTLNQRHLDSNVIIKPYIYNNKHSIEYRPCNCTGDEYVVKKLLKLYRVGSKCAYRNNFANIHRAVKLSTTE